jgi:hypothetical protein
VHHILLELYSARRGGSSGADSRRGVSYDGPGVDMRPLTRTSHADARRGERHGVGLGVDARPHSRTPENNGKWCRATDSNLLVGEDHARVVLLDRQHLERAPHGRVARLVDDLQVQQVILGVEPLVAPPGR